MALVRFVWTPELLAYDFGPGHPMAPARLDLTYRLAQEFGLLREWSIETVSVEPAPDDVLACTNTPGYVAAVRAASAGKPAPEFGLGTDDDPIFPAMHDTAARIVAASIDVAEAVWDGRALHGVNLAGGMHHAAPDRASGFCIYNDATAAITRLLALGVERVAYVDLDAHHGDGVEQAFWNDPRVLTVSLHQDGNTLFPGTGFAGDIGGPDALGTAVNIALPSRTVSGAWLRAFDAVVPEVLTAFKPQVIVSQHGTDAHHKDPLSDLRLCVDALRGAARRIHDLSHELADGRWVALGGGGYAVVDVVPLVWTSLLAEAQHEPLDLAQPLPPDWRDYVAEVSGLAPAHWLGVEVAEFTRWPAPPELDFEGNADAAIEATRKAVFPHLGLTP